MLIVASSVPGAKVSLPFFDCNKATLIVRLFRVNIILTISEGTGLEGTSARCIWSRYQGATGLGHWVLGGSRARGSRRAVGVLFTANNATNRVGPTLTITSCVERGCPRARVLFVNATSRVRTHLIPGTNFSFGAVRVDNFHHSLSPSTVSRGVGAISRLVGSRDGDGGVVGGFSPSIYINFKKCISNPILRGTTTLNVPVYVRRRGTFPNVAGGTLTGGTSGIVVAITSTTKELRYGGRPVMANLPIENRVLHTGHSFTHTRLNINSGPLILSFNNSLNTTPVGRTVFRVLLGDTRDKGCCRVRSINAGNNRCLRGFRGTNFMGNGGNAIRIERCVSGVSVYVTTTSLIVNETNTSSLSRVRTLNGTSVLVPDPCITRGRRCRGTVTLIEEGTTEVVRRGRLADRELGAIVSRILNGPRRLTRVRGGTGDVTIASSTGVVTSVVVRTTGGWFDGTNYANVMYGELYERITWVRGLVVANKGGLNNRVSIRNSGGTILPVVTSTLLVGNRAILRGIPGLSSIRTSTGVLHELNTHIREGTDALVVSTSSIAKGAVPRRVVHRVHSSVVFLNSLLSQYNRT